MNKHLQLLIIALGAWTLLMGSECEPPPDDDDDIVADDDDTADDDDVVADDDDSTPVGSTTIEGEVIALDRESGAILTLAEYAGRAGGLILYVLPDAADLSVVFGKVTMTGPGTYSVTIENYAGPADVVAVVDEDKNFIIDSGDVLRGYAFNPMMAQGNDTTVSDVNVYVDLARRPGGGDDDDDDNGGPCASTTFSGDVIITGYPDGGVAITTNSPDLTVGPREYVPLPGAQDWALAECNYHSTSSVLGCLDADANGFWEPSDPWGDAPANPYVLGLGSIMGVTVSIPSKLPITPPSPSNYVPVSGTVSYDDFLTGNIIVSATATNTRGQVYSEQTIAAPGPFELVVPGGTDNVLIWAALDADSDGEVDVQVDPWDSQGPMSVGSGQSGIELILGEDPPAPGSISGAVVYDGPVTAADCQTVGLFDEEPMASSASPMMSVAAVSGPTYPFEFEFTGVLPGQYWVAAYLDINCDNPSGPGVEDPDGQPEWPMLLAGGQDIVDVEVLQGE